MPSKISLSPMQVTLASAGLALVIGISYALGSMHLIGAEAEPETATATTAATGNNGVSSVTVFQAAELAVRSWRELGEPDRWSGQRGNYFDQGRKPFEAACAQNSVWQQLQAASDTISDENHRISTNTGIYLMMSVKDRGNDIIYAFAIGGGDCAGLAQTGFGNNITLRTSSVGAGAAVLAETALPLRFGPDFKTRLSPTHEDRATATTLLTGWSSEHGPGPQSPPPTPAEPPPPSYPRPLVSQFQITLPGMSKSEVRERLGTPFGAHDDYWTFMDFAYDGDAGKIVSLGVGFDEYGHVNRVKSF